MKIKGNKMENYKNNSFNNLIFILNRFIFDWSTPLFDAFFSHMILENDDF